MLPAGFRTAEEVKLYYHTIYDSLIDSGHYYPFLYPWATLGFGMVLVYLLIDHRQSPTLRLLRFPAFGLLVAFSAWCIRTNRARSPAASYGVGLISAWGTLWTASLVVFNDLQADFQRLDRSNRTTAQTDTQGDGPASDEGIQADTPIEDGGQQQVSVKPQLTPSGQSDGALGWQSYPTNSFVERLDWVIDAFTNFRGLGWNFQISTIPDPPAQVGAQLKGRGRGLGYTEGLTISKAGIRRYSSRAAVLRAAGVRLVAACVTLDVVKLIMQHDPYFWGYTDAPAPTFLPFIVQSSHVLTQSYRLLVALTAFCAALSQVFSLGPLFFCGLTGPRFFGLRGEAWMNPPDFYGSVQNILDNGLAGWWGGWWHQTFRYAFEAPATRILDFYRIEKRSTYGKFIGLSIAFFLSGCLHACGSYTLLGDGRPIRGPFRFFLLQAAGIMIQKISAKLMQEAGVVGRTPKVIRQVANFTYTHVWLYFTAPLLVEDFAQGGVWLYEPLAISPLRMMGFGAKDDNGWDLWYGLVFWRQGKHWWDTGIAF